jgi:hypothetical protein
MGSTFVLGLIPGLRFMLIAHVAIDLVFVLYACMLVRSRNAEADRRLRLQFVAQPHVAEQFAAPQRASSL